MRLITRRAIYRAFPELDRFEDERCARFVRAAGRGFWKHVRGYTVMAVGGALVAGLLYLLEWAGIAVVKALGVRGSIESWPYWIMFLAVIVPLAAGLLAAMWTRDLYLRRRIRRVLRTRGVCTGCRYSLVGLMVGADNRVVCPECGVDTEVDASLGELAVGEDGRARFRPREDPLGLGPRFWTAARIRRVKRVGKWVLIGVPTLVLLLAGGYEGFLWWQAGVAKRERPGPAEFRRFMERGGVDEEPAVGPNAWDVFAGLEAERRAIDAATPLPKDSSGGQVWPDFGAMELDEPPSYVDVDDPESRERYEREREAARRLLRAYEEQGWLKRLEELNSAVIAARWSDAAPNLPAAFSLYMPELGEARHWARIQRGRMGLARRADDPEEFARSLETTLTLAWMLRTRPVLISRMVGTAIEALAYGQVREVLTRGADRRWLLAIEDVLARRKPVGTIEAALRGEELLALEAAAWMFEEPGRVRFGRFSAEARKLAGDDDYSVPLGTYAQNRRAIKAAFEDCRRRVGMTLLEQAGDGWEEQKYILTRQVVPWMERGFQTERQIELEAAATRVMITLEWFRLDRGKYPESLEALGPAIIMPIDPWTGRALGYRRNDPLGDEQGRGYLLYSVGADGVDDGGVLPPKQQRHQSFTVRMPGYDFILNDRER
ncbi:MAG: hypothetical protein IT436_10455 [Phycisphaerales bacterium]|nr:hypothetical protein [Phycisphaerales bacterium]